MSATHRTVLFVGLALLLARPSGAAEVSAPFDGASARQWGERLADSELKRLGDSLEAKAGQPARWDYSPAVFALGLIRLGALTGNSDYGRFAIRSVASHVNGDGTIRNYSLTDYSIDNILPGRVLLEALRGDPNQPALATAAATLRRQMKFSARTTEGAFWHKLRYPTQVWLDGLYMASPFLAQYAAQFHEPALFDDVARQLVVTNRHLYDPKTGLYWHAWDEDHAQKWADPATGHSPHFWSRAIGWYGMAVTDVLDYLPADQPDRPEILRILTRVADGIVKWQDPASGLWWQVTDGGDRSGNYLEASGSAMFVYTLAKGVNQGFLPRARYLPAVTKGYEGLIHTLLKPNPDGGVSLTQVCSVAGLGSASANGPYRDGTFKYYVGEPRRDNDPKGTGAFVLASVEVQKLLLP